MKYFCILLIILISLMEVNLCNQSVKIDEKMVNECVECVPQFNKLLEEKKNAENYFKLCMAQLDEHNKTHNKSDKKEFVCFYYNCGKIFESLDEMKDHYNDKNIHKKNFRIKNRRDPINIPSLSKYLKDLEKENDPWKTS